MKSLLQHPSSYTVMEWLLTPYIDAAYNVAQQTGLLAALSDTDADIDALATRFALSKRGTRIIIDVLVAAGILERQQRYYRQLTQHVPAFVHQTTTALSALVQTIENGVFECAKETGILPSGTPKVLIELGIAEKTNDGQLALTELGRRYFVPGQSYYLGQNVCLTYNLVKQFTARLDVMVKTGQPGLRFDEKASFFSALTPQLFPAHYETAQKLADILKGFENITTVLDVGAGSAVWSIALAQTNRSIQVTAFDFSPVLDVTHAFVEQYKLQEQFRFCPGNILSTDHWGEGPYDLIYLGCLCSGFNEEENQYFFRTCARLLRPGGYLVIADFFPQEDYSGPLLDVLFSITMLGLTDQGIPYPATTYERWCREAGFDQLTRTPLSQLDLSVLIAHNTASSADITFSHSAVSSRNASSAAGKRGAESVVAPTQIIETTFAFAQSSMLLAAVELDLFSWVARGVHTAPMLAQRLEASEDALTRLLDALCASGFLKRVEESYELTPVSEHYLVAGRETYIGNIVLEIRQEWDTWSHLTDSIRTGQPMHYINEEPTGGPFFQILAEPLFSLVYPVARRLCKRLGIGTQQQIRHVADLGAGAAPCAIAALELDAQARGTAFDFAELLSYARTHAQRHQVHSRMDYQAVDLTTADLPSSSFDLIFASHLFRILGGEVTLRLIQQSYAALQPGGYLVVIESFKEPEQAEKVFPHIISLNMLVNTRAGDALSSRQVHQWLLDAGFTVEIWSGVAPDVVLVAKRP